MIAHLAALERHVADPRGYTVGMPWIDFLCSNVRYPREIKLLASNIAGYMLVFV